MHFFHPSAIRNSFFPSFWQFTSIALAILINHQVTQRPTKLCPVFEALNPSLSPHFIMIEHHFDKEPKNQKSHRIMFSFHNFRYPAILVAIICS